MKLCFSSMALHDEPIEVVAEQAAAWGFEGVELLCRPGGHIEPDASEKQAAESAAVFRSAGVRVAALAGYIKFNGESEQELHRNYEDLVREIRLAEILEAESVRCLGGRIGDERWEKKRDEIITLLADRLKAAAMATAGSCVRILQVTHDEFAPGSVLRRVLEKAAHPRVGAAWNVVHTLSAGEDLETTWNEIGARVSHIHLRDALFGGKDAGPGGDPMPFGRGDVPWERLAAILSSGGYAEWISIEWPAHMRKNLSSPREVLPAGRGFLEKILKNSGSITDEQAKL